ncbi:hypothetical protein L6270_00565 [Candidatus Parcubacteria bacterium]|nr:hypothetical protein [Patescibacteria group bacterium]MBU4309642.1 hypothetical protein [Patescibacteria group bacterium]MBU4432723.1 hypothetical protein [Patescibacteria group bacterium]MBU4577970.1 hypothetical protein [Patescibacteria group bacterium]MCG2696521.1 hypothetical protein [Candidatus Parcubacteria bacterium]
MAIVAELQNLTGLSLLGVLVRTRVILADDKMMIIALLEQLPATFVKIKREQFDSMLKEITLYCTDRECECLAEAARRQQKQSGMHGNKLTIIWREINKYADYRSQPIIAFILATIIDHVEF